MMVMTAQSFESAREAVKNMRIGWNLGNTLDSNSGDSLWMWIEATFCSVRGYNDANGQWTYSPWLPSEDGIGTKIQTDWMKRVREVVDYVVGQRLLKKGAYILGHKKVVVR